MSAALRGASVLRAAPLQVEFGAVLGLVPCLSSATVPYKHSLQPRACMHSDLLSVAYLVLLFRDHGTILATLAMRLCFD